MSRLTHSETHMVHRIGWQRAAVLGANDGLVSTGLLPEASTIRSWNFLPVVQAGVTGIVR